MKLLITGSSGLIGGRLARKLLILGHTIVGVDIKPDRIKTDGYHHVVCDLSEPDNIEKLYEEIKGVGITTVFHLAAKIKVSKSMTNPIKYYKNNVTSLINLLNMLHRLGVYNIIFSSTAAVYGFEKNSGYKEEEAGGNLSVYGRTKLIGEQILRDHSILGFKGYIFRFFNVAGEYPNTAPTHLIDVITKNIHKKESITIFGTDYNTKDGTCIRDYIHIDDIISAFLIAIYKPVNNRLFETYNLGTNIGCSVREVVTKSIRYHNSDMKVIEEKRRDGDLAITVSDNSKAKILLDWAPVKTLDEMISDTFVSYKAKLNHD